MSQPHQAGNSDRAAVLTKATLRAAAHLDLSNRALGKILGLSEATISRMRAGARALDRNQKPYEIAALFVRLYRGLDAIVGGDDKVASQWLRNRNVALDGKPIELIQTLQGLMHVIQYVDARRAVG